jgi:small conductance mechanosensitive channel
VKLDIDWKALGLSAAESSIRVVIILGMMLIASVLVRRLSSRLGHLLTWRHSDNAEIKKRADTFAAFIRYSLIFLVLAIGGMMILKQIGVEIGPILASAGVVGLAVGFGAQNLVQDIISGFFILLEDQIRVGDVVNVNGKGGLVEKVGLRMIILRDLDGTVHFIRNGKIDVVSNMTKGFANYVIDLRIPYGQDVERVKAIMRETDVEMRADKTFGPDIIAPLDIYGIEQLAESWMLVRCRTTTKPLRQWDVGREFVRRIKLRLDAAGIPLASPQMRVIVAENGTPDQSSGDMLAHREN